MRASSPYSATDGHKTAQEGEIKRLVCFSHLRWYFVYQRPQHILSRAVGEYEVFFVEEPFFEPGIEPRLNQQRTEEGVTVLCPILPEGCTHEDRVRMQTELLSRHFSARPAAFTLAWYYTPMAYEFGAGLPADVVVYDNMDELSAFRGAPPPLLALEDELMARADLVFTGGMSLFEAKRLRHRDVRPFPSSIDKAHFSAARAGGDDPADQRDIARPRLGFFGVVDERMDLNLVENLAGLRPEWQFVFLGPVVKIDEGSLPRAPNIHWLGQKSYAELPAYLAQWDVGIMPFALNEATRFISPTKTPEFLAAGVPVVSTSISDVVRPYGERGLVEIADGPETFAAACAHLLERPRETWLRQVDAHLSGMSWDLIWAQMREAVEGARIQAAPPFVLAREAALV